ncbi:ThuA domain-containing protein [Roseivirga pacifica]|uniref:ThuA domain-containing protein n=1 Tax=Roseivirga pacifica TaxID=1267423 RepID=UPI00227B303A|nr:ThuA domain-containing protein [Roseivirga pacifica]
MKYLSLLLIAFSLSCQTQQQKHILIYTKNGEGFVHDNIEASVNALKKLSAENNYTTEVTADPTFFTPENLAKFDCIIFSNTNNEAFDNQAQRDAFQQYTQSGGGFVGIHSAAGSERDWPWFWAVVGGKFVRHPALQPFEMKVLDQQNPATNFLGETWQWEDEVYYLDNLNPDIHVLLAADLRTVEDDSKDEFHRNRFGNYTPLAWVHQFDGGRQFFTALGHKSEYYSDPVFLKHLLGGIQWVLQED